jgi:hypothetical protein
MIWLLTFILLFLLFILLLLGIQQKILFIPHDSIKWTPEDDNIDYEDIMIPVNDRFSQTYYYDGKAAKKNHINAWHIVFDEKNPTIMYNHGNVGNISMRDYLVRIGQLFHLNVFLYDYRGFGRSDGVAHANTILEDGQAAYDYLVTKVDPKNIIVWGESLGGCVATYIASKNECRNLLLMSTFSSLEDAIKYQDYNKKLTKSLSYLTRQFLHDYSVKEWIKNVDCPIVIIHSKEDGLIPYECAEILYDSAENKCKKIMEIKGTHSAPKIEVNQLKGLFKFCKLSTKVCPNKEIKDLLHDLENVADKHLTI